MGRKARRHQDKQRRQDDKDRRERQRARQSASSRRAPSPELQPGPPKAQGGEPAARPSPPRTLAPAPKSAGSAPGNASGAVAHKPALKQEPPVIPGRKALLQVRNLNTRFRTEAGIANAVTDVSFDVYEGEVLGIVGESGSGKSVCSLSIMRLIPNPPGEISDGQLIFKGQDLLAMGWEEVRKIRGREIAMIFQEPMTSLNPVYTIGYQVQEVVQHHFGLSKDESFKAAVKLLDEVGIPDPERRMSDYPHQFSGGMRQRAMIAIALACNPSLLIADEPTTALDVTIQAQILELMLKAKERRKEAAVILITHDLAVVAETCQRVQVMYGGKIQEIAPSSALFKTPQHPYTKGLLESLPNPKRGEKKKRLRTIPGMVPNIHDFPKGCRFSNRCEHAEPRCFEVEPELMKIGPEHWVRCHLVEEQAKEHAEERAGEMIV